MAFRDEITLEHESLIPSYRQTWQKLAISTARIDHQDAIEAIQAVYKLLQLPKPEIIFFDSPYAAVKTAMPLYQKHYLQKKSLPYATRLIAKLHNKLYIQNKEDIGHWDDWVKSQLMLNTSCEIDTNLSASFQKKFTEDILKEFQDFNYKVFVKQP
jgi:hypothetical protein